MGYDERNNGHTEHLASVEYALERRGYTVDHTGQEARKPPTYAGALGRWWPDLFVCRRHRYFYVDAKTDQSPETDNYAVELAALACYGVVASRSRIEVVLVWPQGFCNYAMDLRAICVETRANNGSGTAYLLVKEAEQRYFDEVFGGVGDGAA